MRTPLAFISLLFISLIHTGGSQANEFVLCLENQSNLLFVEATANNSNFLFMIDSGSTHNVICSSISSLVSRSKPKPIEGHQHVKAIGPLNIHVKELENKSSEPTLVMSLASISETCGIEVKGILGMPFLHDKSINFAGGNASISEEPICSKEKAQTVACSIDGFGRLYIEMRQLFSEIKASDQLLVDTGMNQYMSLCASCFQRLRNQGFIKNIASHEASLVFSGDRIAMKTHSQGILFPNDVHTNLDLVVHEGVSSKVGTVLLFQRCTCIDFKSRKLHFHILPQPTGSTAKGNRTR